MPRGRLAALPEHPLARGPPHPGALQQAGSPPLGSVAHLVPIEDVRVQALVHRLPHVGRHQQHDAAALHIAGEELDAPALGVGQHLGGWVKSLSRHQLK